MAFQDRTLEDLRRLVTMKEAVASSAFGVLADAVENDALRSKLARIREDAAHEREELEAVVEAWMREGGSRTDPDVASRDIVEQWADLHDASCRRLRTAAAYAPNGRLKERLSALARRDEAHARTLRALL